MLRVVVRFRVLVRLLCLDVVAVAAVVVAVVLSLVLAVAEMLWCVLADGAAAIVVTLLLFLSNC